MSRLPVLAPVAVLAGTSIEVLQRLLPIGRVVSPVDALLNATGAVLTALLVARAPRRRTARERALLRPQ
jgi:VanZ family protein